VTRLQINGTCSDAYPFIGWTREPGYLSPLCCWSCHEDADDWGMPLSETELPDDTTADVCCRVLVALEETMSADPS
jgi:hypothetical protein